MIFGGDRHWNVTQNFFVYISDVINKAAVLPPKTPLSKYHDLLPDKWKQKISLKNKTWAIFFDVYVIAS